MQVGPGTNFISESRNLNSPETLEDYEDFVQSRENKLQSRLKTTTDAQKFSVFLLTFRFS
jgi:hypothetical protein